MGANYLFVYGTLLKKSNNEMSNFLASHAVLIGKGYFYGNLYEVTWYPGAILSNNTSEKVFGMIFKIENSQEVFKVLDDYEGIGEQYSEPHLFKKKLITAFLKDGTPFETFVYVYSQSIIGLKQISSGDFLKY